MISSMTAYGNASADTPLGSVTVDLRSDNSRFLDLTLRVPEELRQAEAALRELLTQQVGRGKLEARVQFTRRAATGPLSLDEAYLAQLAERLAQARAHLPDVPAPRLGELLGRSLGDDAGDDEQTAQAWQAGCLEAARLALKELQAARRREGRRLADMMQACAAEVARIVDGVEAERPAVPADHQEKLARRLREVLAAASPEGYAQISGEELSARIAHESSLFSLRIDVAEELSRLRSHVAELDHLLADGAPAGDKRKAGSTGKRLDFLFQEMAREANTLGSKAGALSVTRAAIDLKLQIEQMREQAQNIE